MASGVEQRTLVRLGDASPEPLRQLLVLRGREVIGSKGTTIGEVSDFYVDPASCEVRYLQVELRGVSPERNRTLVALSAISRVEDAMIYLTEPRDRIVMGPRLSLAFAAQWFIHVSEAAEESQGVWIVSGSQED